MKRKPLHFAVLLCGMALWLTLSKSASAAIAFGTAANCNPGSVSTCTVTITTSANDTVVVIVAIRTTTSTVSSVTDTGGSSYAQRAAINNGTSVRVEIWSTGAGAALASTSVTINLSAASKFIGVVGRYTGVLGLGATATGTGAAANPSISLTTKDSNNWVVAGFSGQSTGTFTAGTGNLRSSAVSAGGAAASNVGGALNDNSSATPASVTNGVTNTDTTWGNAALELRSVAPPARNRVVVT